MAKENKNLPVVKATMQLTIQCPNCRFTNPLSKGDYSGEESTCYNCGFTYIVKIPNA